MLFNTIVCAVYIAASSLLAMQVYMQVVPLKNFLHILILLSMLFLVVHICFLQLLYYYRVIPGFSIYPALTAAYVSQWDLRIESYIKDDVKIHSSGIFQVLGYAAGILHGIDALMALRWFSICVFSYILVWTQTLSEVNVLILSIHNFVVW